jgi:quercetin dioxygenase-like cupin family protein
MGNVGQRERILPFYKISEMEKVAVDLGQAVMRSVPGELMKAGSITYPVGGGPPPHFHPNEEQFVLMMEGKMNMILGDETRIVEKGDLILIPRNTRHGIAIIEGPAVFFTVKSPAGDGDLYQDYNMAADADEVRAQLSKH